MKRARGITRKAFMKKAGEFATVALAASAPGMLISCADKSAETDDSVMLQLKGLRNTLRRGHCAPAVMSTLVENAGFAGERWIKLTAGLPGGIGNFGSECGGVTASVLFLGMEYGDEILGENVPRIITVGEKYLDRFREVHGAINCREIRKPGSGVRPCLKAICDSPGMLMNLMKGTIVEEGGEKAEAYRILLSSFLSCGFHCVRSVLEELSDIIEVDDDLLRASWGFLGGTLLQGMTCGALTAGVLAIGSKIGEIEDSYCRVLRMNVIMMTGGDMLQDDLNKFNRAVNVSHRLVLWFEREFGSIRCGDLVHTDFSRTREVAGFVRRRLGRCREMARRVARQVRFMLT
jgi:C_GCAxxG_C_C family probable redox protein